MTTPSHAQVLAAIDKARPTAAYRRREPRYARAVDAHCDDLRATAERHAPRHNDIYLGPPVYECRTCIVDFPCDDYQQVIDRLKGWGVL